MKKALVILQLLMVVLFAQAQMMNPVKFTSSLKTNGTPEVVMDLFQHPSMSIRWMVLKL